MYLKKPPTCHPEKKQIAKGLCSSCYYKKMRKDFPERQREIGRKSWWKHREKKLANKRKKREDPEYVARCRARDRAYSKTDVRKAKHRESYHKPDVKARLFARKYKVHVREIYRIFAIAACEICGSDKQLHIDHDHIKGHIRGRLCGHCNKAIGLLGDDTERVLALFRYLKKNAEPLRLVS